MKQPWERYNVTEMTYLFIYTAGYNSRYSSTKCPYKAGTTAYKIFTKGRRDAKKI